MRVLVTGSSGAIGRPVCAALRARGDFVRGFDREAGDALDEFVQGRLEDAEVVQSAVSGMDAIVHLAAKPDEAPFEELLGPNLLGVYHVLNAARVAQVRRVVLASSVQVAFHSERRLTGADRMPGNHYAVTKLFAEDMGAMYARRYSLDVIAARIGWMVRNEREAKRIQELGLLHAYISRDDVSRFFHAAVHAPFSGYATLWAMGPSGAERYDLDTAASVIGYEPGDAWPDGLPFPVPLGG